MAKPFSIGGSGAKNIPGGMGFSETLQKRNRLIETIREAEMMAMQMKLDQSIVSALRAAADKVQRMGI